MNPKPTRKRIAVVLAAAAVVTAGTVGAARALSGDDDTHEHERPIPASERDRAEQAALEETGGGTVTGTEVDDEESKYEVEVTLGDGHRVDVRLDESFHVVGTDGDDDSGSDD